MRALTVPAWSSASAPASPTSSPYRRRSSLRPSAPARVNSKARLSGDGSYLVTVGQDGEAREWSLNRNANSLVTEFPNTSGSAEVG